MGEVNRRIIFFIDRCHSTFPWVLFSSLNNQTHVILFRPNNNTSGVSDMVLHLGGIRFTSLTVNPRVEGESPHRSKTPATLSWRSSTVEGWDFFFILRCWKGTQEAGKENINAMVRYFAPNNNSILLLSTILFKSTVISFFFPSQTEKVIRLQKDGNITGTSESIIIEILLVYRACENCYSYFFFL